MNNSQLIFNENKLLEYLINYDYIFEKYNVTANEDQYLDCAEYEAVMQSPDVVKRDYSAVYNNIRLVYGDDKSANKMLSIYKIVKEEIVNKFLNIPGLERLYDEHFFEFEWDMHSRLDFNSHNISFYRDHFIHQVRNLYEMNKFLENESFYEDFYNEFLYGDNKISAYVNQGVKKILKKPDLASGKAAYYKPRGGYKKKPEEEFYTRYIIKASIALSALFHDIGYPILHYKNLKSRINVFMPSLYMMLGTMGNNFDHIYSSLCNSLLFRIVDKGELEEAVCIGENHGAISAVAFLLMFYENGAIDDITEDKRIAIEIAAIAIYNHTIKYKCIEDKKGKSYYRPVYKLNPLSYLLRICDDIQEWDRTYFEIQNKPTILMCPKCGTPLIRKDTSDPVGIKKDRLEYTCRCKEPNHIYRDEDYTRRKIIDIINCRTVRVEFNKVDEIYNDYNMVIDFDYDPSLLLKMCLYVPRYSQYRIEDLGKLSKILMAQSFGGYKTTEVRYTLTPNPFILKARILENIYTLYKCVPNYEAILNSLNLKNDSSPGGKNTEIKDLWEKYDNKTIVGFAKFLTEKNDMIESEFGDKIGDKTNDYFDYIKILQQFGDTFKTKNDWYINYLNTQITSLDNKGSNIVKIEKAIEKRLTAAFNFIRRNSPKCIKSLYKYRDKANNLNEGNAKSMSFYYILYLISCCFRTVNNKENYDKWNTKDAAAAASCKEQLMTIFKKWLHNKAKEIAPDMDVEEVRIFIDDAIEQYSKLIAYDNPDKMLYEEYYKQYDTKDKVYCAVERYTYRDNTINTHKPNTLDYYSDLDLYIKLCEYTYYIYDTINYYDNRVVIVR